MEPFDPYQGDPVLRACVERAIQPYLKLPAQQVQRLRDFLIVHATTHPAIAPLYERLRQQPVVEHSGPRSADAADAAEGPAGARAANDK